MKLVRYRTEQQATHALVETKRTRIAVLLMDAAGIRVRHVPLSEARYMTDVDAVKLGAVARKFRAAGKRFGINKAAKAMLKGVR